MNCVCRAYFLLTHSTADHCVDATCDYGLVPAQRLVEGTVFTVGPGAGRLDAWRAGRSERWGRGVGGEMAEAWWRDTIPS